MQDLTFGEQVKIILSRKDMTIKDLAKKIEVRTRKKMSRQNLTQRLGRDNFQEQDMRMIAEILECPFQLNILEDRVMDEKLGTVIEAGAKESKRAAGPERTEEPAASAKDGKSAEIPEDMSVTAEPADDAEAAKAVVSDKESKAGGAGADSAEEVKEAENKEVENKETEDRAAESKEAGNNEIENSEDENRKAENGEAESRPDAVASNERDITIGEFVDLNEELDAMLESANSEQENIQDHKTEAAEEPQINYANGQTESIPESSKENTAEISQESSTEGDAQEYTVSYTEEYTEEYGEGYSPEAAGEPVEKLLEEIETLEKEKEEKKVVKQEEKPHGWRAYLMQRLKRRGREQAQQETGNTEESNLAGTQENHTYQDREPKNYMAEGYTREEYRQGGYQTEDYAKTEYGTEDYPAEDYSGMGYVRESYEQEGYTEAGYPKDGYGTEYMTEDYQAGMYLEEELQEEEEPGEMNPYTGKEYESNSVRMHPSRIGYVQVYDRAIHKWTDMTEWAFLGYQERKKQLLGKDYDPPIYLD